MITLTLPWPPSNNTYYRRVGYRTLISAAGRDYRTAVLAAVLEQGTSKAPAGKRLAVALECHPPDRRKRDIDNLCKAVLDSVVKAGVMEDDSLIDRLLIIRREVMKGGVIVMAIDEEADRG